MYVYIYIYVAWTLMYSTTISFVFKDLYLLLFVLLKVCGP